MNIFRIALPWLLIFLTANIYAHEASFMLNSRLPDAYQARCISAYFKSDDPVKDPKFHTSELCFQQEFRQFMMNVIYETTVGFSGIVLFDILKSNKPIASCRVNFKISARMERGGFVKQRSEFVKPKDGETCECYFKDPKFKDKLKCTINIQNISMSSMVSLTEE